jgi:NADH-quinone oxidoreductase subunit N
MILILLGLGNINGEEEYIRRLINIGIILLLLYLSIFSYNSADIIGSIIEWIFVLSTIFILLFIDNLITLFISIELLNLAIYVFIYKKSSYLNNINILYYYFINSLISLLLLLGILFIYEDTLELTLSKIQILNENTIGGKLIILSLFIKLGIGSFYIWKINLYNQVNLTKLLFLITIPIYLYLYLIYYISYNLSYDDILYYLLYFISFSLIASAINIAENKINSILIYSSIYNTSLLYFNLVLSKLENGETINYYFIPIFYLLNLLGLFHLLNITKKSFLNSTIYKNIIIILIFSMIGFPPTSGFFGKLYLIYHSLALYSIITLIIVIILLITTIIIASLYLKFIKYNLFNYSSIPESNIKTTNIDLPYAIISISILSIISPMFILVYYPF